jgi:tetratricopeptide (TPR) repeat protein
MDCRQLSSRAASAMHRNDYSEAESLLAQAVDRCGTDPEARQRYAAVLWQRGARDAAIGQLNTAIELAGDDTTLLVRRGEWHLALEHWRSAAADAEAALDANPSAAAAWLLRARLASRQNDPEAALAAYHRVLALEPHHREALWEKAQLHWSLAGDPSAGSPGQLHRALMNVQVLLEQCPPGEEPPAALLLAGRVHARLGRYEDASQMLANAARRGETAPQVWHELAEAHLLAGRHYEAAASAQHALALNPGSAAGQELWRRIQVAQAGRGAPRADQAAAGSALR